MKSAQRTGWGENPANWGNAAPARQSSLPAPGQETIVILPDGVRSPAVLQPNGLLTLPDGSVADQPGTTVLLPDGGSITPEDLPYIFDRFYKARQEENREGSGLGLAIARGIAERHGAAISAENRPGGGAVFTVGF